MKTLWYPAIGGFALGILLSRRPLRRLCHLLHARSAQRRSEIGKIFGSVQILSPIVEAYPQLQRSPSHPFRAERSRRRNGDIVRDRLSGGVCSRDTARLPAIRVHSGTPAGRGNRPANETLPKPALFEQRNGNGSRSTSRPQRRMRRRAN